MSEKKVKAARKAARVASAIVVDVDDLAEPVQFERDMRVPQWPNRAERRRLASEAQ